MFFLNPNKFFNHCEKPTLTHFYSFIYFNIVKERCLKKKFHYDYKKILK